MRKAKRKPPGCKRAPAWWGARSIVCCAIGWALPWHTPPQTRATFAITLPGKQGNTGGSWMHWKAGRRCPGPYGRRRKSFLMRTAKEWEPSSVSLQSGQKQAQAASGKDLPPLEELGSLHLRLLEPEETGPVAEPFALEGGWDPPASWRRTLRLSPPDSRTASPSFRRRRASPRWRKQRRSLPIGMRLTGSCSMWTHRQQTAAKKFPPSGKRFAAGSPEHRSRPIPISGEIIEIIEDMEEQPEMPEPRVLRRALPGWLGGLPLYRSGEKAQFRGGARFPGAVPQNLI